MDKIHQLFIRSCKVQNSEERLLKLYKRFYGDYGVATAKAEVSHILTVIVDEYAPMKLVEYKRELGSLQTYDKMYCERWKEETPQTEQELHTQVMMGKLRYTERSDLEAMGVRTPARFRNK